MKSWMTFLITLTISLSFTFLAHAENPCRGDLEKFCSGVAPGGKALIKCLQEHESEISVECKAHKADMKERFQEAKQACEGDIEKYCSKIKPGNKAVLKCLKKHRKNLSPDCKASVSRKK